MKYFDWNHSKNTQLQTERDVSFEEVLIALDEERLLDILAHKNTKKYPNQKIFVVDIGGYAYLVPFVEDAEKIFLKTIIPSRRATKQYIIDNQKML